MKRLDLSDMLNQTQCTLTGKFSGKEEGNVRGCVCVGGGDTG